MQGVEFLWHRFTMFVQALDVSSDCLMHLVDRRLSGGSRRDATGQIGHVDGMVIR